MVSARIMESGQSGVYDDLAMREILLATLQIARPSARDEIIDRFADETRMAWMHANFGDRRVVEALGDADSCATTPTPVVTRSSGYANAYWTIHQRVRPR